MDDYDQALELYRLRDWGGAQAAFKNLIQRDKDLALYNIYINQAEFYEKNPPPSDWDGVFERRTK
jgi:adenylate cyclase